VNGDETLVFHHSPESKPQSLQWQRVPVLSWSSYTIHNICRQVWKLVIVHWKSIGIATWNALSVLHYASHFLTCFKFHL
jgi:hypothetical protein